MINFKKKLDTVKVEPKTNPIEIYDTLDRKSETGPLRDVQNEILTKWYNDFKDKRDIIVKMHTGEGKTLVGLLMLLSSLNSGLGPCMYICPNILLKNQVCAEAEKFGIPYCVEKKADIPVEFENEKKILIIHAQKVFNGLSVFGTGNRCINVGSILLDDSHTCIDVIKNASTVNISRVKEEELYNEFLELFIDDLKSQGEGSLMDIQSKDSGTIIPIPYWSWIQKKDEVLQILNKNKKLDCVKFSWTLLRDNIKEYTAYISGSRIQIVCDNDAGICQFGSFANAKRRILMSATTQDDAFFVKGLGFSSNTVKNPLKSITSKWSGEKMVIIPSELFEGCDEWMVANWFASEKTEKYGMLALVPSIYKTGIYSNKKAKILDRNDIEDELEKLKRKEFSHLLVAVNRYDGIDLPDETCRILILDGLPSFSDLSDQYEELCRPDSTIINKKIAQKIEQGMGRGVRGEKDYCVIILIGSDLVKFIRSEKTRKYFSKQTQKQIEIGLDIADSEENSEVQESDYKQEVISLVKQCICRDQDWKEYYRTKMDSITEDTNKNDIYELLEKEKRIDDMFRHGDKEKACQLMQKYIDIYKSNFDKGWYLQKLAKMKYELSKEEAIKLQQAAFNLNPEVLKPIEGVAYKKINYIDQNRMENIKTYIEQHANYNELWLDVNEILDNFSFGIKTDKFEEAVRQIGVLLGFLSQRPDKETRTGPDNLWCGNNNEYIILECKSNIKKERKCLSKEEVGQMNNHCGWFDEKYGKTTKVQRYIISPVCMIDSVANFTHDVKFIRLNRINKLKGNIKNFIKEFKKYEFASLTEEKIQSLINLHKLNMNDFENEYSEEYKIFTNQK